MVAGIAEADADVLLLTAFDYDAELRALDALARRLKAAGADYPHRFAFRPNTGRATGLDLDGDGRLGGPGDAQGFGYFAGQGGMAILSRLPVDRGAAKDFAPFPWTELPGALLPEWNGRPFPSQEAQAAQRLSTTGHWSVPVALPDGRRLTLLAWYATPPVFDGPEDRNGRRNHDEAAFWLRLLDGELPFPPPEEPFVLLGDANLDPLDGNGRPEALLALLAHPALQDPAPESAEAKEAAVVQGGANLLQRGPAARDTADWDDGGPGNLRVDYVLPSAGLQVVAAGVEWPRPGDPVSTRHGLVWVDLARP